MRAGTNGHRMRGRRFGRRGVITAALIAPVFVVMTIAVIGVECLGRPPARKASLRVVGATAASLVFVDDVRIGRTDDSGARTFASLPPGRRTVVVRQPGFADDRRTVVLATGGTSTVRPKRVRLTDESERARQTAEFLAADGKHQLAAVEFQRAISLRPNGFRDAEIGLARALLALKDFDGSSTVAEAVAAANPKNLEAQTVLANVLRERGLYDEAALTYRRAIALSPARAPEAHAGLAILLGERGDLPGAAAEYRSAIDQNLDAEPILYQLYGSVLERLERRTEAVAAYERFLELAPNSSLAAAVRSVVEQLKRPDDENPYAPVP